MQRRKAVGCEVCLVLNPFRRVYAKFTAGRSATPLPGPFKAEPAPYRPFNPACPGPPLAFQESKDPQWQRAMDYLSAISELNYMTQIVIMLYEDNNKVREQRRRRKLVVGWWWEAEWPSHCDFFSSRASLLSWQDPSSEERFHVELHFSPGVKGCEEDGSAPAGSGFRPASAEVSPWPLRLLGTKPLVRQLV